MYTKTTVYSYGEEFNLTMSHQKQPFWGQGKRWESLLSLGQHPCIQILAVMFFQPLKTRLVINLRISFHHVQNGDHQAYLIQVLLGLSEVACV